MGKTNKPQSGSLRQKVLALGINEYFDSVYSEAKENTLRQYASSARRLYGRRIVVAKDRMVSLRVIRTA